MTIQETLKEYTKYGLSVILTKEDKLPALTYWGDLQKHRLTPLEIDQLFKGLTIREDTVSNEKTHKETGKKIITKGIKAYNISEKAGIITGTISGNLEVIDVDTKYDITGSLWNDLRELIENTLPDVLKALVISQTMSGGYHLYYKCREIGKNDKLARRPATKEETERGDKVNVLIETRGEGGYVIAPPTRGYKYIQGSPDKIPTISPEDRKTLLSITRTFDQMPKQEQKKPTPAPQGDYDSSGLGSFDDYNQRGDVVALLKAHGWTEVNETGDRIYLLRPGETKTKTSGNYHKGKKLFFVWSTSTEFEAEVGYNPTQIFTLLEAGGDLSTASKKLYSLGYGDRRGKAPTEVKTDQTKVEGVTPSGASSIIAEPGRSLKTESIKTGEIELYNIYYTSTDATGEILKALELLEAITEGKVYLKEVDRLEPLSGAKNTLRAYEFKLKALYDKYTRIEDQRGGALTKEDEDNLQRERIEIATRIKDPLDRDKFIKRFSSDTGITEERIQETVNNILSKRARETQAKELKDLLFTATKLQQEGKTDEALEEIRNKTKEIKLRDKATEFGRLLSATPEEQIRELYRKSPESLNSGYTIGGEELLLPSGALTGIAGATGHGKTNLLINLTLNAIKNNPEKRFYFFTYEMGEEHILVRFLNTFQGLDLNNSKIGGSNQRLIKNYYKTDSTQYINRERLEHFESKKAEFFRDLIDSGRLIIKGLNYLATDLSLAIRYLKKKGNVGGIFIDYFQLLSLPKEGYKNYSRQEELKIICQEFNTTAKDTGLPIILGAQFNREVNTPFKLHATNIGEAGDIERILDTLLGIWDTNKLIGDKLTKAQSSDMELKRLREPNKLYAYLLKSRETASELEELLDYNGNTGVIKNNPLNYRRATKTAPVNDNRAGKENNEKDEVEF